MILTNTQKYLKSQGFCDLSLWRERPLAFVTLIWVYQHKHINFYYWQLIHKVQRTYNVCNDKVKSRVEYTCKEIKLWGFWYDRCLETNNLYIWMDKMCALNEILCIKQQFLPKSWHHTVISITYTIFLFTTDSQIVFKKNIFWVTTEVMSHLPYQMSQNCQIPLKIGSYFLTL